MQQSIQNITEDVCNQNLSYVTHNDVCKCFDGDTLLAVRAPQGTQLKVPQPEKKRLYQIHLKSTEGQIYVLLVNKDSDCSEPMVMPVPPPKEIADAIKKSEESEKSTAQRRSGRGKTKASSPPEETVVSKTLKLETDDEDSSKEVDSILSRPSTNPLMECDDLMTSESKFLLPFSIDSVAPYLHSLLSVLFGPLMRLSPPPTNTDYYFNLAENEGVCDLFDAL